MNIRYQLGALASAAAMTLGLGLSAAPASPLSDAGHRRRGHPDVRLPQL